MGAETLAIVLGVVLFLDWGVGFCAVIAWGTFLAFLNEGANVSGVEITRSATILFVMVIDAHLVIVLDCDVAWTDFENIQV